MARLQFLDLEIHLRTPAYRAFRYSREVEAERLSKIVKAMV